MFVFATEIIIQTSGCTHVLVTLEMFLIWAKDYSTCPSIQRDSDVFPVLVIHFVAILTAIPSKAP